MGASRDPFRRRPQRTLLPGIGVASAVLAGALVAVTLAAGLVSFDSGPGELAPPRASTEQRIAAVPVIVRDARPRRERPAARRTTASRRSSVRRTARGQPAFVDGGDPETRPPPPPPPSPPPPVGPEPPARPATPLEPIGNGLDDTTDGLADTVRGVTEGLGDGVAPVSPELGSLLTQLGEAIGDIVEGTGNLLGDALGGRG